MIPFREALAEEEARRAKLRAHDDRIAAHRASAAKRQGEADAACETVKDARANALLSEKPYTPPAEPSKADVAELEAEDHIRVALKLEAERSALGARRSALVASVTDAVQNRVHAALLHFPDKQAEAQRRFKKEALKLHDIAACMCAAEMLRNHYAGERPVFDGGVVDSNKLWSAEIVLARFISALPARLAPEGFTIDSIMAEARRLADAAIADVEGTNA